jgi:glutamine amidotransferase
MLRAPVPFISYGDHRNPHGWGLGWYEDGRPQFFKDPRPAPTSRTLPALAAESVSTMLVAHLRKASPGLSVCRRNCHPFVYDKWAFAHNGTIRDAKAWRTRLQPRFSAAINSETDSEIYFLSLLQAIDKRAGDIVAGVRDVTTKLRDFNSANFLLTDGVRLFAYRNSTQKPHHFSLSYRCVKRPALTNAKAQRPTATDIQRTPHVVVCSNRLTKSGWRPIPLRHLLIVEADCSTKLVKI